MVVTEKELMKLQRINGFENLGKFNETLLEIYEQLDNLYKLINSINNDPKMKNFLNRSKTRAKELEKKIYRLKNEYYNKLDRYEKKYGKNEIYFSLKELIDNRFYVVYENKYAIMDEYIVNYNKLKKKNNKIINRNLKIAKKEMM